VDWYSPPIYDIYFDDYNVDGDIINKDINGSDDIIDEVLVNKIKIECKENMAIITKVDVFKGYMDTINIQDANGREIICQLLFLIQAKGTKVDV